MARKQSSVNDEKLLNDMFVTLEYSDSWDEFMKNLSDECYERLLMAIEHYQLGV